MKGYNKHYRPSRATSQEEIEKSAASELFEQAHFLYGTQSIEETVRVLEEMEEGREIAKKALA